MRLRVRALPLFVAALSVACAAVLGIEDITNEPEPADAGVPIDVTPPEDGSEPVDRREPVDTGPGDTGVPDGDAAKRRDPFPSCLALEAGCGTTNDEDCCSTLLVEGGTFNRSNNPNFPATVSEFRLDEFEVTVGRFRAFYDAYPSSRPALDAGARPNLPGSGWNTSFNGPMPADKAELATQLACDPQAATFTPTRGANEQKPINCISWVVAFAFCVWDGARLPTEAEWNIAAAAGSEQRVHAWGMDAGIDPSRAVYIPSLPAAVGSKSPAGDGKYGHADLHGNMGEMVLDVNVGYSNPCMDCAPLVGSNNRTRRGGDWDPLGGDANASLNTFTRIAVGMNEPRKDVGVRCARPK